MEAVQTEAELERFLDHNDGAVLGGFERDPDPHLGSYTLTAELVSRSLGGFRWGFTTSPRLLALLNVTREHRIFLYRPR